VKFSGIILAAGASRRMGTPKALLQYGGETFLERLVRVFSEHLSPVIVVLGHHADALEPLLRRQVAEGVVRIAYNPHPEQGQLSSLQCGLHALEPDTQIVIFTPVDIPAIEGATVAALAAALCADEDLPLAIPTWHGERGHPVGLRRDLIQELLALPSSGDARTVLHRHYDRAAFLPCSDEGILRDIDDRADYEGLAKGPLAP
jgi:molybdenum cofactor cytidylyltransferase